MARRKKVTRKFNWRKLIVGLTTFIVIMGVLATIICVGTDVSTNVANQFTKVCDSNINIEKTDYGYKLTKKSGGDFKLLQLTDIHIGGGIISIRNDRLALTAVGTVVQYVKPDFIIVTGDVAYPIPFQSGSINNLETAKIFVKLMDNLGIPWTITYGNHDTESYSLYNRAQMTEFYESVALCLMSRGDPNIFGYGNQIITLHNSDGYLNSALVLIDSNQYRVDGLKINQYDCIRDDQVEWYKREIRKLSEGRAEPVQSFLYFHIPLKEYVDAYEGSLTGEYEKLFGDKREKISISEYDCKMFEAVLELQSTKAIFVGHDHTNDFCINYKGVYLTYGKSIDYLAFAWAGIIKKTEQRGGTILDIKADGSFNISVVRYVDIQNSQK